MFYPILRLQTDELGSPQVVATTQRSWRPMLLVGRELCVFESVACKGVAWHELGGFATLQAKRLAPHLDSGASAAVRNKVMMLWFWDEQDVQAALRRAGRELGGMRLVAETLLLDLPVRQGQLRLRCAKGVDSMTLDGGAIVSSQWDSKVSGIASASRALGSPWARDLLGGALDTTGGRTIGAPSAQRAMTAVCAAAAVGCAVYAAYWGGSLLGARQRLAALEGDAELTIERAQKLAGLRKLESQDREWVTAYRDLGGSFQVDTFLQALAKPLAATGVVMKELEVRNEEARLVLVSAGGEIDLPGMLEVLGRMPGVSDVALRDNVDVRQATFTMHTPGYRRVAPTPSRPY